MSRDIKDFIGKKFGKLTILERAENNKRRQTLVLCRCDCGKLHITALSSLLSGHTKSCGCTRLINFKKKYKDLTNMIFGNLLVIQTYKRNNTTYCECKCSCGNIIEIRSNYLTSGHTKSCGCLAKKNAVTHDLSNTRLYPIWCAMKARCYNTNNKSYKNYGARGIAICDEWKNDFVSFYNWSMVNGYNENAKCGEYTLDRIDVNGNYEPSNCRWTTIREQQYNKRNNIYIENNGIRHSLVEWLEILNISRSTVYRRLRNGWNIKSALFTKVKRR